MKIFQISLLVILIQIAAAAQQPTPASLQGVVVQTGSGSPLGNATVEVRPVAGGAPVDSVTTNRDGLFVFPKLPPGPYRLVATRDGYVKAEYGQKQPNGPALTLTLAAGQRTDNIRLTMFPGGVISGRVTDNGQPVGIADVIAVKLADNNGQIATTTVLSARTNDLGEYRIFWLPPGRYYVAVTIFDSATNRDVNINPLGPDNSSSTFAARGTSRAVLNRAIGAGAADNERHILTFYPSTLDPERATPIDVQAGAEVSKIDINAPALITHSIRGKVTGVAATAVPGQPTRLGTTPIVLLRGADIAAAMSGVATSVPADATGSFDIPRIPSGSYVLSAVAGNLTGSMSVEVRDRDIDGIEIKLVAAGVTDLSGRIVIERQTPVNPDPGVGIPRVFLITDPPTPASQSYTGGPVQPDGTFKIPASGTASIQPGTYRVIVSPVLMPRSEPGSTTPLLSASLTGAYVKSIRLAGQDVLSGGLHIDRALQDPLEIVIGTNPGSLEGRVMNDKQQAAGAVWVALIPNSLKFRVDHRFTSTDSDGKFQFQSVPPGDYKVYAWEDIEKLSWQEPKLMAPYESRGTPVHVDEGRKTTIDFTSIP